METTTAPPTTARAITTASISLFMAPSAVRVATVIGEGWRGRDVGDGAGSTEEGEHGQGSKARPTEIH